MRRLLPALLLTATLHAQWQLQPSGTTASLRGIHAVSDQIAWASGTGGTVLRTTDGGQHWLPCAIPSNAGQLDFRGIQAFDATTAIVMSSGKGDLSRLYKTTDACRTWQLVFTNPDPEGFWDAISLNAPNTDLLGRPLNFSYAWGHLIGDSVDGQFVLYSTSNGGNSWTQRVAVQRGPRGEGCRVDSFAAKSGEAVFAASNESLLTLYGNNLLFVTGGSIARLGHTDLFSLDGALCHESAHFRSLPIAHGDSSAGAFALAAAWSPSDGNFPGRIVIVGGDYKKPDSTKGTAVTISHISFLPTVTASSTPPHGFRSAVAYSPAHHTWITVGPNGTDLSTDDGRNWRPLRPTPTGTPGEDRDWNALSLPFVVGPNGRIGRLRPNALP